MKKVILDEMVGRTLLKAGWKPVGFHLKRREVLVQYKDTKVVATALRGQLLPIGAIRKDAVEPVDEEQQAEK